MEVLYFGSCGRMRDKNYYLLDHNFNILASWSVLINIKKFIEDHWKEYIGYEIRSFHTDLISFKVASGKEFEVRIPYALDEKSGLKRAKKFGVKFFGSELASLSRVKGNSNTDTNFINDLGLYEILLYEEYKKIGKAVHYISTQTQFHNAFLQISSRYSRYENTSNNRMEDAINFEGKSYRYAVDYDYHDYKNIFPNITYYETSDLSGVKDYIRNYVYYITKDNKESSLQFASKRLYYDDYKEFEKEFINDNAIINCEGRIVDRILNYIQPHFKNKFISSSEFGFNPENILKLQPISHEIMQNKSDDKVRDLIFI